jgi:hypothetical protein
LVLTFDVQVFVWFGSGSNDIEKKKGQEIARRLARNNDDGRPSNAQVVVVLAGQEPPNFLAHFQNWDSKGDDYTQKLRAIQAEEMALKMSGKKAIAKVCIFPLCSLLRVLLQPAC